ncbi:hypothetical protein BI344_17965 [Chromobacterium sphagni]|nr:hypothetical protein BI344_17965 [Chromobacterium sphagni]
MMLGDISECQVANRRFSTSAQYKIIQQLVRGETLGVDAMTATFPEVLVPQAITAGAFDADDADVRNNLGLLGLLDVYSRDGRYRLTVSLEPVDPDRQPTLWALEVEMEVCADGKVARHTGRQLEYSGSAPGSYLRKLLANGELHGYLVSGAAAAA